MQNKLNSKLIGAGALLLTAFIWGTSFVSQVAGMDALSPFAFNAVRFTFGAVSLLPVVLLRRGSARTFDLKKTLKYGLLCGCLLFCASSLQQYGVLYGMNAGRAGFITGLYIILVPLLGILIGKRARAMSFVAAVVSLSGLYLLCFAGSESAGFGIGDVLLLGGAVFFAIHILVVERIGTQIDPMHLSILQISTVAALSWVCTPFTGGLSFGAIGAVIWPILYSGVASTGIAYTLQIFGQNRMEAAPASIIMSLESFFSVVGGAVALHETMSVQAYIGCGLMLAGTILAQIPGRKRPGEDFPSTDLQSASSNDSRSNDSHSNDSRGEAHDDQDSSSSLSSRAAS
ncbi:MAG: DMT family transporter [Bifidobacteriaceae bacterium]|nr:DMT family transporter [Bifidobacteriaceae bacterium]